MPGSESKAQITPAANLQNAKSFADVAMERGYCSVDQISKARAKQRATGAKELREAERALRSLGNARLQEPTAL